MTPAEKLITTLQLEELDFCLFRGDTIDVGSPFVFGGQVLAQALNAATRTVAEDRFAHSLHAYFILPGDKSKPIIYDVENIRDGKSFTTRRIVAKQNGKAIFNMAASFQKEEKGLNHQVDIPDLPPPEQLQSFSDIFKQFLSETGIKSFGLFSEDHPIEARPVEVYNPFEPGTRPAKRQIWFRWKGAIPEDPNLHRYILTYFSDFSLLVSALLPHDISYFKHKLQIASLDHAMWFHRNFNLGEWMLYTMDSPSASNGRGFSKGQIFTRDGDLVATVTQEGLIRVRG